MPLVTEAYENYNPSVMLNAPPAIRTSINFTCRLSFFFDDETDEISGIYSPKNFLKCETRPLNMRLAPAGPHHRRRSQYFTRNDGLSCALCANLAGFVSRRGGSETGRDGPACARAQERCRRSVDVRGDRAIARGAE